MQEQLTEHTIVCEHFWDRTATQSRGKIRRNGGD